LKPNPPARKWPKPAARTTSQVEGGGIQVRLASVAALPPHDACAALPFTIGKLFPPRAKLEIPNPKTPLDCRWGRLTISLINRPAHKTISTAAASTEIKLKTPYEKETAINQSAL